MAVGDMESSSGLPSLATVWERLREMWGRKRDWRKVDFSFLGVEVPLPSSECLRVSPLLLMRKKFLMRCETWLSLPLTVLLVDRGMPEKVRFSVMVEWLEVEELKSCVMAVAQDGCRRGAVQRRGGVAAGADEEERED